MNVSHAWTRLHIAAGATRLIEASSGLELHCVSGTAWITQYGDDRDLVLSAGRSAVLSLPTAIVTSSLDGAVLLTRPASTEGRRRGWLRRLLGLADPRWSGAAARALHGRVGPAGS